MMRMKVGHNMQARILVVDDDPASAQALQAILLDYGYEVAKACSDRDAADKAAKFIPDLLLSGVSWDLMTGIKAATRVTAMLPQCRVLFLSGRASISDIVNAVPKRLVYSFTTKPLHPLDLLNVIAYMLSAVSSAEDQVAMAVQQDAIKRYAGKWMRARVGSGVRKARAGAEEAVTLHGHPDAVLHNMSLQDAGGREVWLH
jgi:DNA-binding NtrC family response regulator